MKAAVLTKLNEPLEILDLMDSGMLDWGQVMVRVLCSGICGAQLQEIAGHKGNADFLPHMMGHEGCGMVERIGDGVTRVKVGQKVVMHWRPAAGIDAAFPRYRVFAPPQWWKRTGDEKMTVGGGKVTTFSEKAIVSENRLTPVPMETPNELAALLGCGLSTALGTIESEAKVKFGESVLIVGVGGLGANLIRAARMAQAALIVATDIHMGKARLASEMGAHSFVHASKMSLTKKPKGFDVIIDTAGTGGSMEKTLPLLADSGRYIMVGQTPPGKAIVIEDAKHLFGGEGKMIKATQGGGFLPHIDIPRYIALHRAGLLNIDGIISRRLRLSQVNKGIDLVRDGHASRVIIEINKS